MSVPFPVLFVPAWNPLRLGSSLVAWWTADRADLITLSGTAVTNWRDVVAGYDAAQSVSASRPTYSRTSFNGAPGLTFDGIDDCSVCTDSSFLAAVPSGSAASEVMVIAQQSALAADTSTRCAVGYGNGLTASGDRRLRRVVTGGVNRANILVSTNAAAIQATDTAVNLSSRHLLSAGFGSAVSGVSVDAGATTLTTAAVPDTVAARLIIGALPGASPSQFWSGLIRDCIITKPLNPTQQAELNAWALPRRML